MTQMGFEFNSVKNHPDFQDLAPHIVKHFWKYHEMNPRLWDLFKRFSVEVKASGRKRYGVKALAERIRWHIQIETHGDDFKMSNNVQSCYARLLMIENPSLRGLFQLKRSKGFKHVE